MNDLALAFRLLLKRPAFAAVVVLTLAVGIGATTAVFSIVNTSLLRPLAYDEPRELLIVWETHPTFGDMSIAYPNYLDWRERIELVELGVYRRDRFNLSTVAGPEQLRATMVSANLFDVLGVAPQLGRTFRADEDRPGADPVVILTHGYWQRQFAGDTGVIGTTLTLNGQPYEVVGVMPSELKQPTRSDVFVPIGQFSDQPAWIARGNHPGIYGYARLDDGVTLEAAQAEIDAVAVALGEQYPDTNFGNGVQYTIYEDYLVSDIRPAMMMLGGAVLLVLLIACVNVANLLLARTIAREREFAVRSALGAGRARVARQVLTESVLLSLVGGALGVFVAYAGIELVRWLFGASLPRVDEIGVDGPMLAFAAGAAMLTGLVFGVLPAAQGARGRLSQRLHGGARGGDGRGRQRTQDALVVSEIALAFMLLVGAALLLRSFASVLEVDPGFEPDAVVTAEVRLAPDRYADDESLVQFWRQLGAEVGALPGVDAVGITNNLPFVGGNQTSFRVEGRPAAERGQEPFAEYAQVSPSYFDAIGMRLLRGRLFDARDHADAPAVMVIDQGFAEKHWPGADPIGQRVGNSSGDEDSFATVVGIVATVQHNGLDVEPPRPQMYFPLAQSPDRAMNLVVRSALDADALTPSLRRAVSAVNPDQPVGNIQSYDTIIGDSLSGRRLSLTLLGVFAGLALALALIGIYAVVSYRVGRRSAEFGVRVVLGAGARDIRGLVLTQAVGVAAIGIIVGAAGAAALVRVIENQLFAVGAYDPLTFVTVPLALVAFTLLAAWVPARRASRVDPMEVLRDE